MTTPALASFQNLTPADQAAALALWQATQAFWADPSMPQDSFLHQVQAIRQGMVQAPATYRARPTSFDTRTIHEWWEKRDLAAWTDWCQHGPALEKYAIEGYALAVKTGWVEGEKALWNCTWAQNVRGRMVANATGFGHRSEWLNNLDEVSRLLTQWRPTMGDGTYRTTLDRLLTVATKRPAVFAHLLTFAPSRWKPGNLAQTLTELWLTGIPEWQQKRYANAEPWKQAWAWMPEQAAALVKAGARVPLEIAFRALANATNLPDLMATFWAQPKGTYTPLELALMGTSLGLVKMGIGQRRDMALRLMAWGMPLTLRASLDDINKVCPFDGYEMANPSAGERSRFLPERTRSAYKMQTDMDGIHKSIEWDVGTYLCSPMAAPPPSAKAWLELVRLDQALAPASVAAGLRGPRL